MQLGVREVGVESLEVALACEPIATAAPAPAVTVGAALSFKPKSQSAEQSKRFAIFTRTSSLGSLSPSSH